MKNQIFILGLLIMFNQCTMKQQADLIVYNAQVITLDSANSIVQALAIADGQVLMVGSTEEVLDVYESESKINVDNACVYPGFIDAHCHFYGYGSNQIRYADLVGCEDHSGIIERLRAHQEKVNLSWVLGRGWDQNLWPDQKMPDMSLLNNVFPDVPVFIIRIDGHAALVNRKALEIAGPDVCSKLSPGANSSGLLMEDEIDLIRSVIPELTKAEKIRAIQIAEKDCFANGLTSVADAGLDKETVLLMDSLQNEGKMLIGIYAMLNPSRENMEYFVKNGIYQNKNLNVRSIKLYADGALGSRGACLLNDYSDQPGNTGKMNHTKAYFEEFATLALENGYQVNTHAIGDSANRFVLNLYSDFLKEKNDLRWRIEHAQVIDPADIDKFSKYSIIPSVQTTHATSDMYWADERLGNERIKNAYIYKTLMKQNGYLPNGTDFPVEKINPILSFYSACIRKDLNNYPENGFQTENALTRSEALRSITIWAAKANFEENIKGSIEAGKRADFTILNTNLLNITDTLIPKTKVLMTVVGGRIVFNVGD